MHTLGLLKFIENFVKLNFLEQNLVWLNFLEQIDNLITLLIYADLVTIWCQYKLLMLLLFI